MKNKLKDIIKNGITNDNEMCKEKQSTNYFYFNLLKI